MSMDRETWLFKRISYLSVNYQTCKLKDFHHRLLWFMCLHLEGVLSDGLNDFFKEHFGGERVSVVDHGLSFITVPAVQLNTATPLMQSSKHTQNPGVYPQTKYVYVN